MAVASSSRRIGLSGLSAAAERLPTWLVGPLIPASLAAVLGVLGIGDKSVWQDEAFSISIVKLPIVDLLVLMWRNEQQMAPYHLLLQPWSVLGSGEAVIRLLSVVIGVCAVLATYAVGRRYGVGFGAALILAVAPFFIEYEQEARGYTLFVAWSALTTLAYLRLVEQPDRGRSIAYILGAGAMIYVHPMGAWVIVAHGLATILFGPPVHRARLLAMFVPVVVAWLPMFRFAVINADRTNWIAPTSVEAVAHPLVALGGGLAVGAVLVLLVSLGLRRDVTALWLIVPVVGMLLMSFVKPVWVDRYLVGVLPALAVVAARGLATRRFAALVLAGVVSLSLIGVADWYANGRKDDWRSAVAWIQAETRDGDGIVFSPNYYRLPFAYYGQAGDPIYPHLEWARLYLPFMGLSIDPPESIDHPRIWVIRPADYTLPEDIARVIDGYAVEETRAFGSQAPIVDLFVRVSPAGRR